MSNNLNLLIYSILYNEMCYLPAMLDSLLSQSDKDFTLLVSDNHSTDGTQSILESYMRRFERIHIIKPEKHLSGIEHGHFVHTYILNHFKDHNYVMFLGGHDLITSETIAHLKNCATENPNAAVIYTDTFRLSIEGKVLERYPNSLNTTKMPRHLIPFITLLGIGHNIMSSGIWRTDVFDETRHRHVCCAADHLLLCEAALSGPITHAHGGALYLRDAPTYSSGWSYYVEKHIPEAQRIKGCTYDFSLQLNWLVKILEKSLGESVSRLLGNAFYENYFLSAMQLYLIRYGDAAQGFHDYNELSSSPLLKAIQENNLTMVLNILAEMIE